MAHVHAKDSAYFTEQLCTIAVCGALGGVAITLWAMPDGLILLGPQFQAPFGNPWLSPVLWGGIAVVAAVLVRAVAVWFSVGKSPSTQAHDHDHVHDHGHSHHDHDHDHDHCDHDHDHGHADEAIMAAPAPGGMISNPTTTHQQSVHSHEHTHDREHDHTHEHVHDHGHEHGWAPWRYVVLLIPVGFYFLGLIPKAFSDLGAVNTDFDEAGRPVVAKGGDVIRGFLELERAAGTEASRQALEGRKAEVTGQAVVNTDPRRFGLVRYKISCCAADAVPLNMRIEVSDADSAGKAFSTQTLAKKWVTVTGIIQFRKIRGSDEYVTVLEAMANDVVILPKVPDNPFVY
jgi:hypothetical protein